MVNIQAKGRKEVEIESDDGLNLGGSKQFEIEDDNGLYLGILN